MDNSWLDHAVLEIIDRKGNVLFTDTKTLSGTFDQIVFEYFGQGIDKQRCLKATITVFDTVGFSHSRKARFWVAGGFILGGISQFVRLLRT